MNSESLQNRGLGFMRKKWGINFQKSGVEAAAKKDGTH